MDSEVTDKQPVMIRPASLADCREICTIYNQGIEDRIATLETELKNEAYMAEWFAQRGDRYKVLVAERAGVIEGWASLNRFSSRACYNGVADISLYVRRDRRGKGVGGTLLSGLLETARTERFHKLVLSTFPFNAAGQRLYSAKGFRAVGTYERQGLLDGRWIDVLLMEKLL